MPRVDESPGGAVALDVAVVTQDPRFKGGALAQIQAFATGAVAVGRSPTALYAQRPPLSGPSPLSGVPAVEIRPPLARVDALRIPQTARRLRPHLESARSIWVVATIAFYGLAALRSGRRYGCWIGTTLGAEHRGRQAGLDGLRRLSGRLNGIALRSWERDVLRGASVLYAPTRQIAGEIAEVAALEAERIRVLPIPIDTSLFAPLEDADWASQPPRLVFVGRADDPRKNVGLLLEAFRRARKTMPELQLRLVGRPPVGNLPEGVEAVGEVRDVARHVRDARLLVLPSVQEGFGIVAAEALSCGVPVVTTPCGGPEETVRRSGAGRVLDGFGAEELSEVTLRLVSDERSLVAMRHAGRRHVLDLYGIESFRSALAAAMDELDRVS